MNLPRPKILIVDDEIDLAEILADFLQDDFECTVHNDPHLALSAIAETSYAAIVTDMNMPGISGLDIIISAQKNQPKTPVIILTGESSEDQSVKDALSQGACGVITKPFSSPNLLIEQLKTHTGQNQPQS